MNWLTRLNAVAPAPFDGVEIYSWSYAPHLPDNVAHRHTFFEICLVGDWGQGTFTVQNTPCPIQSGDLFITRPGVIHRIQNRQKRLMELFWVAFGWSAASESDNPNNCASLYRALADSPVLVARDDGLILTLWQSLRAVAEGAEHAGKDAQLASLQRALLLQIAVHGAGDNAPLPLPPVATPHRLACLGARYIQDNMARKLGVAEVAAHLHLSPRQFQRVFSDFAGTSPSLYIETARLDRARHLLRVSNEPIKAIALKVGYPDVHHFTRVFSKHCGISPAAFRSTQKVDGRIIQREGALI